MFENGLRCSEINGVVVQIDQHVGRTDCVSRLSDHADAELELASEQPVPLCVLQLDAILARPEYTYGSAG